MTNMLFSLPKWREAGSPSIQFVVRNCTSCGYPISARLMHDSIPRINKQCRCTGGGERWTPITVQEWSQLCSRNDDDSYLIFFARENDYVASENVTEKISYVIEQIDDADYDFDWVLRSTEDGSVIAGAKNSRVLALVLDALVTQQKA